MAPDDPHDDIDGLHTFAGGEIQSRHGTVNRWLMVVYVILASWAVYYLITYWSGP